MLNQMVKWQRHLCRMHLLKGKKSMYQDPIHIQDRAVGHWISLCFGGSSTSRFFWIPCKETRFEAVWNKTGLFTRSRVLCRKEDLEIQLGMFLKYNIILRYLSIWSISLASSSLSNVPHIMSRSLWIKLWDSVRRLICLWGGIVRYIYWLSS